MSKLKATEHPGIFLFICPGCDERHQIWTAGTTYKSHWDWNGSMEHPTFSPSLLITLPWPEGEERCHSFIKDGMIQYLDDCTHEMKGQTIELPEIE